MCTGIFIQDSNIYAQEEAVLGVISKDIPKFGYEISNEYNVGFAPKNITIRTMAGEKTYLVYANSASEILNELNISLDTDDEIIPSPTEYIPHNGVIVIVKVESEVYTNNLPIYFKKITIEDNTLDKGTKKLQTKGVNGILEKKIRVIYKDDVAYRSEVLETNVILKPVDQVTLIGTKPVTIASCSYWNNVIDDIAPKEKNKEKNTWMKYVMLCESGCDSGKGLDKYFEGSKAFYGLYQFTEYTFKAYGGTNMFDGYDQIEVVSRMYDMTGNPAHHWPACNNAFERDYNK